MKADTNTTKDSGYLANHEKGLLLLALRDYQAISNNEEITKMITEIKNKLKL
tara:strand:- start:105 stop:260 length:156 start_codon:yes stop_codon:yes gene_type:complete